jgi:hypothetical protein
VEWIEVSAAGGLTVGLREASGTYNGNVVVRRFSASHGDGCSLEVGAPMAICGVRGDTDGRLVADRSARYALAADDAAQPPDAPHP